MTKARDNANGGLGLILIKPSSVVNGTDNGKGTVSFSSASTISLNNVFSSTYDMYVITGKFVANSGTPEIQMRLRVSNSDNSSAQYRWQVIEGNGTSVAAGRATSRDAWFIARGDSSGTTFFQMSLNNPFSSTDRTSYWSQISQQPTGTIVNTSTVGSLDVTTSYTGFTLITESAIPVNGFISVYGYNK